MSYFHDPATIAGKARAALPVTGRKHIQMILRRVRCALMMAFVLVATPALAHTELPVAADVLRAPPRAIALVSEGQQDAYRSVMSAYAREEAAHPRDVALVMARCRFVEAFSESEDEDLAWADKAQADDQACQKDLQARFPGDAEVGLYIAEHRYGQAAVDDARSLLTASSGWSPTQRSRLHAVLARSYAATKQPGLAGEEALASAQLDPASSELVAALKYLCDENRRDEAEALLAKVPVPTQSWMAAQRVRFALDHLSAAAALAELQRAEHKARIDPLLSAKVYQRAGMNAKAAELLAKTKSGYQNVDELQLRVNIFTEQGDAKAASMALHDWFGKTGITMPLLEAYGATLAHAPGEMFSIALAPLTLALLIMLAVLACVPGLIAFPAHYRGTVRQRLHKPMAPLFATIGLRHMWLGLGAFLVVSTLVPLLGTLGAIEALTAQRPISRTDETTAVVAQVAMTLLGLICLLPSIRGLSWRDWLGHRGRNAALFTVLLWASLKAFFEWVATHAVHATHAGSVSHVASHDRLVAALATSATHIGGIGLALFIVAVLVPIYEELVFRGCMLGGLTRHLSFGWANVWQAVVFALMHMDLPHFHFYFLFGLVAGWLVRRTRGLAASMALHAANNAIACIGILGWI